MNLLTLIVLLPLAGFLLNGLAGPRAGKTFVSVVGCGLPILAFLAAVRCFLQLQARRRRGAARDRLHLGLGRRHELRHRLLLRPPERA